MTELQPLHHSCGRRHRPELRCWTGRYVRQCLVEVLAAYGPLCVHCGRDGADSVDHVVPRAYGGTDALDNMRPSHRPCNSSRGTRAMPGFGARTVVVMGPPASGKSYHVLANATRGDVVVDLDHLAAALTVGYDGAHDYPDHVRHVAIGARREAIKRARALREDVTAWIIHAMPSAAQLAEYTATGAELVTIDPGPEVVLRRCRETRPAAALDTARAWYAQASDTPTASRAW